MLWRPTKKRPGLIERFEAEWDDAKGDWIFGERVVDA
jgi:hypothetical protein